jgi:hypothetical protein
MAHLFKENPSSFFANSNYESANRKFANQACSSQNSEIAGRYISYPSEIGFELFCQLIASNMYDEMYPHLRSFFFLHCRMVSSYSCKAKVIKTICGINSVNEVSSQTGT